MPPPPKTTIALPAPLARDAARVARALGMTRDELAAWAVSEVVQRYPDQEAEGGERRAAHQGEVYWVTLSHSSGRHPHVIVSDDALNHSRLTTVAACAVTSNLRRAQIAGNVTLDAGEGGLAQASVVEVSKVSTVAVAELGECLGQVSAARVRQILAGLRFVRKSFWAR
ncbi:MAG: type II toxin-antitoxin system PemK/MazF family toxin [Anaerolineales bacterium]|nr:type II toxin-antitoxin system PemK/MazF family toxin [Anaerolineales bacterium]